MVRAQWLELATDDRVVASSNLTGSNSVYSALPVSFVKDY